jgi:hypothetical protein
MRFNVMQLIHSSLTYHAEAKPDPLGIYNTFRMRLRGGYTARIRGRIARSEKTSTATHSYSVRPLLALLTITMLKKLQVNVIEIDQGLVQSTVRAECSLLARFTIRTSVAEAPGALTDQNVFECVCQEHRYIPPSKTN